METKGRKERRVKEGIGRKKEGKWKERIRNGRMEMETSERSVRKGVGGVGERGRKEGRRR